MRLGHPVRKKGLGNLTLTGHVEDKKDKVKRIEGRTGVWEYGEKTKKKRKNKEGNLGEFDTGRIEIK